MYFRVRQCYSWPCDRPFLDGWNGGEAVLSKDAEEAEEFLDGGGDCAFLLLGVLETVRDGRRLRGVAEDGPAGESWVTRVIRSARGTAGDCWMTETSSFGARIWISAMFSG